MSKKFFKELLKTYLGIDLAVMILLALIVMYKNTWLGLVCLGLVVLTRVFMIRKMNPHIEEKIDEFEEGMILENNEAAYAFSQDTPLMICIANRDCETFFTNSKFDRCFENEEEFRKKVGKNFIRQFFENDELRANIDVDGKTYRISSHDIGRIEDGKKVFFFENITAAEIMKNLYKQSKVCVCIISVDNYDELISSSATEDQSSITAEIDRVIMAAAAELDAAIMRVRSSRYLAVFEERYLDILRERKFPLLDQMHEIETDADFPTTVSISVGTGAANIAQLQEYAEDAMELALGRGGDQAVVKNHGGEVEYFGGALTTVEKRNKGKSRIMAHALGQLINSSDKVLVMGHKRPDMDSIGAAIGISALARAYGIPAYIVMDDDIDAVDILREAADETELYKFVSSQDAEDLIDVNTLLVVVDVSIPPVMAATGLLSKTNKLVVIDHHRKSEGSIDEATLSYTETYASSTSELITELLQYSGERVELEKFDADALLAGITLDTKNFTQNTGVRTFEAASWLKRNGAENAAVASFFKMNLDAYKKKVNIIASAEILENGVAIAYTNEDDPGMQMLVAQAADELLDMRNVQASIVAGRSRGKTAVSARSNGQVNVQILMEMLGGGGHVNVAAAQVDESPENTIANLVNYMRTNDML